MRPILLVFAGALLLLGCGDGDDGLSVEEYRKKANELCAEVNGKAEKLDAPKSADGLADYFEELLDMTLPYDRRFRELDPPPELENLHEDSVELSKRFEKEFRRLIERVRQAESPGTALWRELEKLLPEIQRADEITEKLKLPECLVGPELGSQPNPS